MSLSHKLNCQLFFPARLSQPSPRAKDNLPFEIPHRLLNAPLVKGNQNDLRVDLTPEGSKKL